MTVSKREVWVDNVKVVACVLVVLGHFWQSMVASGFSNETALFSWFDQTIYTFHMPLFFICSGYLYQRSCRVLDGRGWILNVRMKLVALGVPYAFFTCVTLAMKLLAGDATNAVGGGVGETLLLEPTASYWYLYVLFFIFLVTPNARDGRGMAVIFAVAALAKALSLLWALLGEPTLPYFLAHLLSDGAWFAGGMALAFAPRTALADGRGLALGVVLGCLFLLSSVAVYVTGLDSGVVLFVMGVAACASVVLVVRSAYAPNAQTPVFGFLSRYTMPIYLMHTIFAAGFRVALVKLGVTSLVLHVGGAAPHVPRACRGDGRHGACLEAGLPRLPEPLCEVRSL